VLDNDRQDPTDIKKEIISQEKEFCKKAGYTPVLNEGNFKLYPSNVYSIEYYLFEAQAICKAANRTDPSLVDKIKDDIKQRMNELKCSKKIKPKEILKEIWNENNFGPYHEVGTATSISKFISKQHLVQYPHIEKLVEDITA
jgi:hypothetical protein